MQEPDVPLTYIQAATVLTNCWVGFTGTPPHKDESFDNMPRLGATFVPGGFDDYYMPEVLAPAPQR